MAKNLIEKMQEALQVQRKGRCMASLEVKLLIEVNLVNQTSLVRQKWLKTKYLSKAPVFSLMNLYHHG